jgi:hypothetical protein
MVLINFTSPHPALYRDSVQPFAFHVRQRADLRHAFNRFFRKLEMARAQAFALAKGC